MRSITHIEIDKIIEISEKAGKEILAIYNDTESSSKFETKQDNSPLTKADISSHNYIAKSLRSITPNIPLLSEENASEISFQQRSSWETYWLVDPLDGTKEFLKRNGEFTVNIALMKYNRPVIGIIHIPCQDKTYFAKLGAGSFIKESGGIKKISAQNHSDKLIILVSKSHLGKKTSSYIEQLKSKIGRDITLKPMGSSLKFCAVAEGSATIYPRFAPTMEWDTAAGELIIQEAGGSCFEYPSKTLLEYNKKISLTLSLLLTILNWNLHLIRFKMK